MEKPNKLVERNSLVFTSATEKLYGETEARLKTTLTVNNVVSSFLLVQTGSHTIVANCLKLCFYIESVFSSEKTYLS